MFWRDPALPYVESRRACHSRACYRPHAHPTFSIGAVDAGASLFTGVAGGPVALRPGSLVFVPASHVHACNPAAGGLWSYQMVHLDAAWLQAVRRDARGGPPDDGDGGTIRVVTDRAVYDRFNRLNRVLFSGAEPGDKEAALIEFVGDCDPGRGTSIGTAVGSRDLAGRIRPVQDHLGSLRSIGASLDELARLAGMSRYQLIRAFRAVTGLTPHAWQLNWKINIARKWICRGDGLADVAYHLGFSDQAHFQRVFKAHTGVTPGRFRA